MDEHDNHSDGGDEREATRTRLLRAAVELGMADRPISLTERVEALGFGVATANVFDLLPVIHVAWADSEVQREEREAIFRVLDARGIEAGDAAYVLVDALLEEHPGKPYMDETLAVLHAIMAKSKRRTGALVDLCFMIAAAHGAGPLDPREERALQEVADALGERAQTWVKAKFGEQAE